MNNSTIQQAHIRENQLRREATRIEDESRKQWFASHCLMCQKSWGEINCGIVKLSHFEAICLCADCNKKCEEGLPIEAETLFYENYNLHASKQRHAVWKCNNGRLWIHGGKIPEHLRTTEMKAENFYGYEETTGGF